MLDFLVNISFIIFAIFGLFSFIYIIFIKEDNYEHLKVKENLVRALGQGSNKKLKPIYLKGKDIHYLTLIYSNPAPVIIGFSHNAVKYSYPGYEYTLFSYLRCNNLIIESKNEGKIANPNLFFYEGVLLDGLGSFIFDDGSLVHEAKLNYAGLRGDPIWWNNKYGNPKNIGIENSKKDYK